MAPVERRHQLRAGWVVKRREERRVLAAGDKAPQVTGESYDGTTYDLGAPGRRTVLFFYPKAFTGG
jgi:hypothetical protein